MAENIGRVIVSIEAKVEELERGLAKAEATMRQSASRLEAQQKTLGSKFKKSWTELSSKINVATVAIGIAEGAVRGITGAMDVFAEKGTSSAAKVGGAIQAFGDAGIPIISQVINVAEGIAEVFVRSAAKIREVQEALNEVFVSASKAQTRQRAQAHAGAMSSYVDNMATRIELMKRGMEDEVDMEMQLHIKRAQDRVNLETQLQKQLSALAGMGGDVGKQAEQMVEAKRVALELFDFETGLLNKQVKDAARTKQEAMEKEVQAAIRAEKRKNDAIKNLTMNLQTKLAIVRATYFGDTEKAQLIALGARVKREKEAAIALGETTIPSAEKEAKEKGEVRKSKTGELFEAEMKKIADEYRRKVEAIKAEMSGAESKSEEDIAKRQELRARRVALIQEKSAKEQSLLMEGVDPAIIAAEIAKVEAKYKSLRAERSKATKEQLELIDRIALFERAAIKERHKPADTAKGQVATIQTALGSFTVGIQHEAITAKQSVKQTTLLQAIASASPTTATAATKQVTLLEKANGWLAKITDKEVQTIIDSGIKPVVIGEQSEVALADSEIKIVDLVNVSIPEKQITLLTDIADKTHAKEQTKVLEKIAVSSAKVVRLLSTQTSSGIIIAS